MYIPDSEWRMAVDTLSALDLTVMGPAIREGLMEQGTVRVIYMPKLRTWAAERKGLMDFVQENLDDKTLILAIMRRFVDEGLISPARSTKIDGQTFALHSIHTNKAIRLLESLPVD